VARADGERGSRTFFLEQVERPVLHGEDAAHARRVLRLGPGDELTGLDGRGGRWPLRVSSTREGGFVVEATGEPTREPAPGEPGAPLPWIEVAVAIPKEKRAEAMLDRLVQLGAAAVTPLAAERSQAHQRELSAGRRRRLERIAREACKQCGRSWLPELHETLEPAGLLAARPGSPVALLSPDAARTLPEWARELDGTAGTRESPLVLVIGPEGGFTRTEEDALQAAGACPVRIAPHVLRIETASEAALAGLVQTLLG
jgi:16S rRNA (uracil1498-N3)-methyltransferase